MPGPVSVSVVISTLNRAPLLRKTLQALERQNYDNFEVVVVNGPSTDGTAEVLASYGDRLVLGQIDEANLSRSRNLGINLSCGELILFLDDDAFAEPDWIATIVAAYDDPRVGGVGTRVHDHTGFAWQTNPFLVDRYYEPDLQSRPPLWGFEFPDSDSIPHILGASSSFRRSVLQEIGGFDEEIEYFLDESEACRRVVEAGYRIRFLTTGASVHHQFAAGVVRDQRRILTRPYAVVKNKYYVCLSDWRRRGGEIFPYLEACDRWLQRLRATALAQLERGEMNHEEYRNFLEEARLGMIDGRQRALEQERRSVTIAAGQPARLRRFPTRIPEGGRRTYCLISRWTPHRSPGGVARYMWDMATGLARLGHEVHLITQTDGASQVEFIDGLWLRQLSARDRPAQGTDRRFIQAGLPALRSGAAQTNVGWARQAHAEVLRLRQDRYIDLVMAPVWDQEGLYCTLDPSLQTIVSLHTTFRRFAEIEQAIDPDTRLELSILEDLYIHSARMFHANSASTLEHLHHDFGVSPDVPLITVPNGARDIPAAIRRETEIRRKAAASEGKTRILYVSRLERRKGTDLFLEACAELLRRHDNLEIDVIGRDPHEGDPVRSFREVFRQNHPEAAAAIRFHGQLPDADLIPFYQRADIFCVPSRYESFGIIYTEAMAYSLPVVALDIGGARDIVVDGETGRLVAPNVTALVRALEELIASPRRRRQMGQAGRQRFETKFENRVVVRETAAGLARLLERDRAPDAVRSVARAHDTARVTSRVEA